MIRVLHNYGGRNTNEQRILPGDYHCDDERLFGLWKYLVANGHAVVLSDDVLLRPDTGDDTVPERENSAMAAMDTLTGQGDTEPVPEDEPELPEHKSRWKRGK